MELYRRVFWPDTHCPFHDPKAVEVAIQIAADFKPHEIVFLGDYQDCYCVGQYTQDPEKNFNLLSEELEEGKELLGAIVRRSKARSVVYLEGNHENRIARYIATYGPRLGGLQSIPEILGISRGWKYLPYGQKGHYRCGNWVITHGTLCTKYSAAAMVAKYGCNVLFGHVHKIQRFQTSNFAGEAMTGLTCGWLGDKERAAEYVKNVADYSHGLALGWWRKSGRGVIQAIPIENYEAVVDGKAYG